MKPDGLTASNWACQNCCHKPGHCHARDHHQTKAEAVLTGPDILNSSLFLWTRPNYPSRRPGCQNSTDFSSPLRNKLRFLSEHHLLSNICIFVIFGWNFGSEMFTTQIRADMQRACASVFKVQSLIGAGMRAWRGLNLGGVGRTKDNRTCWKVFRCKF